MDRGHCLGQGEGGGVIVFEAGSVFMGLEGRVVVAAVKGCVRVVIIAGSRVLSLWVLLVLWVLLSLWVLL